MAEKGGGGADAGGIVNLAIPWSMPHAESVGTEDEPNAACDLVLKRSLISAACPMADPSIEIQRLCPGSRDLTFPVGQADGRGPR